MLSRRTLMVGGVVVGGAALAGALSWRRRFNRKLALPLPLIPGRTHPIELKAAERPTALPCFGERSLPMWTFREGSWPPIIRLKLGEQLDVVMENHLPRANEYTSIHWHGCRLPNSQDGVPYLIQQPVLPGQKFHYKFMPPDTGTFFFHTHCNTAEQLGRGLQGVVIVEGDTTEPYDADVVLFIRDWHVDLATGEWTPFTTLRGAGRSGTYGSVRGVNGAVNPEIKLPASGDCRLRLINGDPTRIVKIAIEDGEAAIIAIDGFAVQPLPFTEWTLGPAMRIDLVLRAPLPGKIATLIDQAATGRIELAHFTGTGEPREAAEFDPAPLHAARVAEPDLNAAMRLNFAFERTDQGQATASLVEAGLGGGTGAALGALCISSNTFWSINAQSWPGRDHAVVPAPIATLERGKSYVFALQNKSPFTHPIHIHGHTFKLISSNRLSRPEHHTDTLLLLPDETAEVAFVADNPGNWMFHCHVIEHQENGMMSYLRVA